MTAPDPRPPPGPHGEAEGAVTRWYLADDGRVISRTCGPGAQVPAPAGARPITGQEAAEHLEHIQRANQHSAAERERQAAVAAESDYQTLINLGMPAHLAIRLSGHQPGRPPRPPLPPIPLPVPGPGGSEAGGGA